MKLKFLLFYLVIAVVTGAEGIAVFAGANKPYIVEFNGVAKAPASTGNQIVKEGPTWRYHSDINANMDPQLDIYINMCFSGTTEIDGNDYYNCYVWQEGKEFSDENAALIAYMREENGKVYARYIPDADDIAMEKGIDIVPYAPMMANYSHDMEKLSQTDVLLYDNSLEKGDMLYSTGDNGESDRFIVKDISEVECFGVTRKVWNLLKDNELNEFYEFYEGIGDIIGLLPMPGAFPITYESDCWRLVEVVDEKGNPLFAPSKMTTGINGVDDDAEVVKESFHDLNGIEVNTPLPTGVYVKTQTLSNGSVRTEKVMVK